MMVPRTQPAEGAFRIAVSDQRFSFAGETQITSLPCLFADTSCHHDCKPGKTAVIYTRFASDPDVILFLPLLIGFTSSSCLHPCRALLLQQAPESPLATCSVAILLYARLKAGDAAVVCRKISYTFVLTSD